MTIKWNPYEELLDNAYWIADYDYFLYICSVCGVIAIKPYKTCPCCKSEIKYIAEVDKRGCMQNKLA